MENSLREKKRLQEKRTLRVRKRLRGSAQKPRLCVIKTNAHICLQLIDDEKAHTLASTSTFSADFRNTEYRCKNKASAKQLGLKIADLAKEKNVRMVVFDRGRFKYHGVIAAVAEGAREGGLQF